MASSNRVPSPEAIERAKVSPAKWVYVIDGDSRPGQTVSSDRIQGAWRVSAEGEITDAFVPYSELVHYEPRSSDGAPLG